MPGLPFDPDPDAIIVPGTFFRQAWGRSKPMPSTAVVTWMVDAVERAVERDRARWIGYFSLAFHRYDVAAYWVKGFGEVAVACCPIGAPGSAIVMENLIALGARSVVAVGSCGDLNGHPHGQAFAVTRALRSEGTSAHYTDSADPWIALDADARLVLEAALEAAGLPAVPAATWTTDAMMRETQAQVDLVRDVHGCQVVDMECSALAAVARFRGVSYAHALYAQDTLADADGWQHRQGTGTGPKLRDRMLRASCRAAANLG